MTPEGQHVLAHELAHVRQQTGLGVRRLSEEDGRFELNTDPGLEKDAEETAQRVLSGGELSVHRLRKTAIQIQRWKDQPRDELGQFDKKDQKEYEGKKWGRNKRPPYAPGQVEEVWERANEEYDNLPDGQVADPYEPWRILEWHGGKRKGIWEMGHKQGREYQYLVEYYLRGIISLEEFEQEYKDPDHYHPQHPSTNQSGEYDGEGEYWVEKWGELEANE